ncbi:MAG: glycoside hydrolase family 140 protein [Sedimentisphaerales bacterium]|nr:glycoside hydrolase family 140 protein [Sedimentisphaerales bacterium]
MNDVKKAAALVSITLLLISGLANAKPVDFSHGPLRVNENNRNLVLEDGTPFFWLADTAWQLIHDLTREEIDRYLSNRTEKGFTVIQTVILAEYGGLDKPNAYGHFALHGKDPSRLDMEDGPNNDYWDHVEYALKKARQYGLYVGLLPTWGRYVTSNWQNGLVDGIFNSANAEVYGMLVAKRLRNHDNIIWIIGGDRAAPTDASRAIWRAMAKGVTVGAAGVEDYSKTLMTYHTSGPGASWWFFNDEKWIDIRAAQSGHGQNSFNWQLMQIGYSMKPVKPMLDLETAYPGFRHGRPPTNATDDHARRGAYWSVFAGSCGHTYGHHSIWQMHDPRRRSIANPKGYWYEVLDVPSAFQMGYLRELMESRSFTTAVADQGIILTEQTRPVDYIEALRGRDFLMVYTPTGKSFTLQLGKLKGKTLIASWFNPRNGKTKPIGNVENKGAKIFDPPGEEKLGNDWVLVLDVEKQ